MHRKLIKKFGYPLEAADGFVADFRAVSALVEPESVAPEICRDPADAAILGTALAARADMLVSVDKDLLDLDAHASIDIVNPREFFRHTHT